MRVLVAALVALLLGLQAALWLGKGGPRDVARLERQIDQQEAELAALEARNNSLAAEVMDLKEGLEAVEELARSEMGMVQEGEIFIQLVEPPAGAGSAPGADEPAP